MKKYLIVFLLIFMIGLFGCTSEVAEREVVTETAKEPANVDDAGQAGSKMEDEGSQKETTDTATGTIPEKGAESAQKEVAETTPMDESTTKEFKMVAKKWSFEPETITVKQGDTVLLHVESIDVKHGISLPGFGINENLNSGETVDIEFVADKKGSFPFICSVWCGAGHGGMKGTLIVE